MREVGAFEAEDRMSQLLNWVEAGEEVVITRNGKPIARLVPPKPHLAGEQARGAAAAIRMMSIGIKIGPLSIRDLTAEGRL